MIFKITVSAIRPHINGAKCSTWRAYVLEPTREKCAHEVAIDAAHWEGLKIPKVVAIGPAQVGDGIPAILAVADLGRKRGLSGECRMNPLAARKARDGKLARQATVRL